MTTIAIGMLENTLGMCEEEVRRTDREQTEDRIVGFVPLRLNQPPLVDDQAAMHKQIKGSFELDCPNCHKQLGLESRISGSHIECAARPPIQERRGIGRAIDIPPPRRRS
ncbi:uncharacterized protein APUU_41110A [Aspergillus puulaauensis]|uniref:Uncharacterized protein n=1 Tax=Aspergillus puulaauensis TaxID=1220207 RepID=A0A7R7XN98_9EURO|nr:uncharacterized protein APUU_41110A [Aspergillus puulaauensis]BCS24666.1 hypothetical protein APUU_41110A [Aspergillus puulaauensis]